MATNLYKLGGLDMYTTYGYVPMSGSNPILQFRKRKEPFSNNWPEENGLEYDLTEVPKYEDRTFNISGWIIAVSKADFYTKYNALFDALNVPGTLTLESIELEKTVEIMYMEMSGIDRLTRMNVISGKVVVKIDLVLKEVQQA